MASGYLYITEDQDVFCGDKPTREDAVAVGQGFMHIIDLSTGKMMDENGEWADIPIGKLAGDDGREYHAPKGGE